MNPLSVNHVRKGSSLIALCGHVLSGEKALKDSTCNECVKKLMGRMNGPAWVRSEPETKETT